MHCGTRPGSRRRRSFRVVGASHALRPALLFLHQRWLPASGDTRSHFPLFAQRVTLFPDVPEDETITDLYLPLA